MARDALSAAFPRRAVNCEVSCPVKPDVHEACREDRMFIDALSQ
jgi:hypothetical protein